jgi:hypothetical protein
MREHQGQCGRNRVQNEPGSPRESGQQHVEVKRFAIPPDRDKKEGRDDRGSGVTGAKFPKPSAVSGPAPDQETCRHERERDDDVERAAPRRQIGARAREQKERDGHDELNPRERDEDQEATPAALFI